MNIAYTFLRTTIFIAILSRITLQVVNATETDFILKQIISLETRVMQLEQQTSKTQPIAINKSPSPTQIIGTWQAQDRDNTVVNYFSDGRIRMAASDGREFNGKWVILPDGRLKIEIISLGRTITQMATIHFDNTDLIMTYEDSKVAHRHKRIR